jgi:membrane protease YdiL (CAAX protease family)
MRTAIGQRLKSSPGELAAASATAALVVAADLALVWWNRYPASLEGRSVLALLALAANLRLVQGDLPSLGLRLTPLQGWWHWVWVSLLIGLAVAACILVGLGVWVWSGHELPIYTVAPDELGPSFLHMCVFAPVVEETTYRIAVCMPLAVLLGPWKAIAVSGLAFGGLHVASGNPSPENLVGGFFLAWAYLRSESIAVPVLLHGLGNLCALSAQVGAWYWLRGAL